MDKEEKESKKISVSIESLSKSSKPYAYFLVQSTEDSLRIDLAEKHEGDDEIEVVVKESIAISADAMLRFTLDIIKELVNYEKKYNNGKGLPEPNASSHSEV